MPRAQFQVMADVVTVAARHYRVRHYDIRIHVVQADQRRIPAAHGYDFEAFVGQNPLADSLRVRAIIHQQDAGHCCG